MICKRQAVRRLATVVLWSLFIGTAEEARAQTPDGQRPADRWDSMQWSGGLTG
jgi:hypothetical protein